MGRASGHGRSADAGGCIPSFSPDRRVPATGASREVFHYPCLGPHERLEIDQLSHPLSDDRMVIDNQNFGFAFSLFCMFDHLFSPLPLIAEYRHIHTPFRIPA